MRASVSELIYAKAPCDTPEQECEVVVIWPLQKLMPKVMMKELDGG